MNVLEEHGFLKAYDPHWKEWWYMWRDDGTQASIKVRHERYKGSVSCDLRQEELYLLIEYLGASK